MTVTVTLLRALAPGGTRNTMVEWLYAVITARRSPNLLATSKSCKSKPTNVTLRVCVEWARGKVRVVQR